jgi:Fe-S cluster biogenesis protein NfuA
MTALVEVTEAARRTLQTALPATSGAPAVRVSVRVADGGAPAYDLTAADIPADGDTVVDLDGLVVYVDPSSAPLLADVQIDHVDSPQGPGFLFRPSDAELTRRVKIALETVRPQLQADGGDVELVEVREARATLRFQGTCVGCGLASLTLTQLLERHLRAIVPELATVTAEPSPRQ